MSDITVKEFSIEFPLINLAFKENNLKEYDLLILNLYTEKCRDGFKVKKIYKTSKKGTKVRYEAIKDKVDFADYIEKVKKLVVIHNEKYGTSLKLT